MDYDAITMVIEYGVTAIATGFDTDLSGFLRTDLATFTLMIGLDIFYM